MCGVLCTITRAAAVVYRGPTDLRSISSVRLKQPYHALVLRRPVASKSSLSPDGRSRVCRKLVGVVVGQAVTAGKSFCWLWALRAGRRGGAVGKRCPNPLHKVLMVHRVIRGEAVTKVILAPPHLLLVQPLLGKRRGQHPDLQVAEQVSLCPSVSCPSHCPGRPREINFMSRYICFSQNGPFDVSFEELCSKAKNPGGFFRKIVF